jgi:cellulose synthase/poly-beta-1,6-N-acetylglucosamine synthase-like glycosyltransferase
VPVEVRRSVPSQSWEAAIIIACALTIAAALAWLYLLVLHGGYWLTGQRLPSKGGAAEDALPRVTAVIPARNEAEVLPRCLPGLLSQDYGGRFAVILVDDDSTDGTGKIAEELASAASRADLLTVVTARPTPPGWAGKVWAMSEGARAASARAASTGAANARAESSAAAAEDWPGYLLLTDADIS